MLRTIAEAIAPDHCLACGIEGKAICSDCANEHLKPRQASCFYCNRYGNGRTCPSCRPKTSLDGLQVAYYFEPPLDEIVYQLKYFGNRSVASLFAETMARKLPQLSNHILSYVPITGTRLRARSYNQAELLARSVGEHLLIRPSKALIRTTAHEQIGQNRTQRFSSVYGNFVALGSRVSGRNVILVDDVVTTGATLNECARVLKLAGARRVWGLALAKK